MEMVKDGKAKEGRRRIMEMGKDGKIEERRGESNQIKSNHFIQQNKIYIQMKMGKDGGGKGRIMEMVKDGKAKEGRGESWRWLRIAKRRKEGE